MRSIPVACLALLLAGCIDTLKESGAEFMDEALETAEFVMCKGASVGSVQRRYGVTREAAAAWQKLCLRPDEIIVAPAAE